MTLTAIALLTISRYGQAQTGTNSVAYSILNFGAATAETTGASNPTAVGYALLQPAVTTTPTGVAILEFRRNGVLITETGVPATATMTSGRTYAEVNGPINTAIALENPSSLPVVISYSLPYKAVTNYGPNSFTLAGSAQIAKFLSEAPFNIRSGFAGTFSFVASAPVAIVALRTLINERSELLITTQTVASLPNVSSGSPFLLAHFADGGG